MIVLPEATATKSRLYLGDLGGNRQFYLSFTVGRVVQCMRSDTRFRLPDFKLHSGCG